MRKQNSSLTNNKDFIYLWATHSLSILGSTIYLFTFPILLYELTRSPVVMSTFRAIDMLPAIAFGMFIGVLVDRFNRKAILFASTFIQIIIVGLFIILFTNDSFYLWVTYLLVFILSIASNAHWITLTSILPQIILREQLTAANAKFTFMTNVISSLGPVLVGLTITFFSVYYGLTLHLISLLLTLPFIYFTQIPRPLSKSNSTYLKEIKLGIKTLLNDSNLSLITFLILIKNLSNSLILGVLIYYMFENLSATTQEVGLTFGIGSLGGIIGSIIITKIIKRTNRGRVFVFSILIDLIGLVGLILANVWWLIAVSFCIRTFSGSITNILFSSIRQDFTPNHILGRVVGFTSMLVKITFPMGLLLSGIWAEFFPIDLLFIIATFIIGVIYILTRNHPITKIN